MFCCLYGGVLTSFYLLYKPFRVTILEMCPFLDSITIIIIIITELMEIYNS